MEKIDKNGERSDIESTYVAANLNQQNTPSLPSDSGSDVADEPDAGLAADAAAYLEASGASVEGFGGNSREIDRQALALAAWAKDNGRVLPESFFTGLFKHQSTTAEHQVYWRALDNRAVKLTHAGSFGVTPDPKGAQRAATPLFYLRRLELMNRVFNSGLRFEGIVMSKSMVLFASAEQPRLVTTQPWIDSAWPEDPHPSGDEIKEFMEALGFTLLTKSYYGWQRRKDRITILDARADNFILSPQGVVPIDLVISESLAEDGMIIVV